MYRETLNPHLDSSRGIQSIHLLWTGLILLTVLLSVLQFFVNPTFLIGGLIGIAAGAYTMTRPYFGLLLYYFIMVLRPAELVPGLQAAGIEKIVVGMLVVSYVIVSLLKFKRINIVLHPVLWAILAFFGVQVLSMFVSVEPTLTFEHIIEYGKAIVFILLVVQIVNTPERFRGFIWMHIILMAYLAISGVIAYMTGNVIVAQGIERIKSLTSAGGDPNSLAASMDIALPFVLVLVRRAKTVWLKGVLVVFGCSMAYAVILSGSRGGLLGLLAGLFLLWLTSKQKVLYAAVAVVATFAAVSFMPKQYIERYSTIANYAEGGEVDESSRLRLEGWQAGWEMFLDHPIMGVGANTFGWAHAEMYSPNFQRNSLKAHSMYFQIIAELGFVGVVSFVWLLFMVVRDNIRMQKRLLGMGEEGEWFIGVSRAIIISIFVLCITAVFGHSLYRFHWLLVGALTVAMYRVAVVPTKDGLKGIDKGKDDEGGSEPEDKLQFPAASVR